MSDKPHTSSLAATPSYRADRSGAAIGQVGLDKRDLSRQKIAKLTCGGLLIGRTATPTSTTATTKHTHHPGCARDAIVHDSLNLGPYHLPLGNGKT